MGYVYILVNESMPGLIKIGKTKRHPKDRARELYGTGQPTPFEVAYELNSHRYHELEKQMHIELTAYRVNQSREFFRYPVDDAIKLLEKLGKDSPIASVLNLFRRILSFRSKSEVPPVTHSSIKSKIAEFNSRGNKFMVDTRKGYELKQGVNGKPYYSKDNGFDAASNANGIPAALQNHVKIIIDNEELEITSSREQMERQIEELRGEINEMKADKDIATRSIRDGQKALSEKQLMLAGLNAMNDIEESINEKNKELSCKRIKLAESQTDLDVLPSDEATDGNMPKHNPLRLYRIFGVFCIILSLALYFFYISALDKGFFSNTQFVSEDIASYDSLNEVFDPAAFFRAIQKANLWLILFPIFPLGLALVIHPFWTSAAKQWESGKKSFALLWVFIALMFVALTLVFDSVLALQISKKIHETNVIMGFVIEEWTISPINPFTWDLNIVLVLFCGFFVSVLLSVLFHFALEMWKEARTQSSDDRNSIIKQISKLETEMKNLEEDITRLSDNLKDAKQRMETEGIQTDSVLIESQIYGLETDIRNLQDQVEVDNKHIESIESQIKEKESSIDQLQNVMVKRVIDIPKLEAQVAEFLVGWTNFLAAKGDSTDDDVKRAQEVGNGTLKEYFDNLP